MKTFLALFIALTFAAPAAAQTIQSGRQQERNYQTMDRGDARLMRVAQADDRRSRWGQGAQRQQRAERPQRQQRAERPQRQQRAERPQRPQRQAQRNFGNNERNATADLNRRQADRGPRGGNAFGQGAGPNPNRWNRNRNEGPRGNPNWNGRNDGNVYSRGPTGRNPNRWDPNSRFDGPVGNRNQNWNGRRDYDGRYARSGPGRDRNWNGRNWNRRDFNYNNRYNNNRFNNRYNDRRYADRYNRYNYNNGRQFYFRGRYRPSIRVSPYYWPRGYNYTRWTIGAFLPSIFFSTQYYFNDYYNYGITPPPPGYQWVRYGPDLLLVDPYTREVVDVVYGAFYW